jgi:signal transduction histidine kinase
MKKEYIDDRVLQILRWSILVQLLFLLISSFAPRFSLQENYFKVDIIDYLTLGSIGMMGLILIAISIKNFEKRITKNGLLAILYSVALITILSRHIFSFSVQRMMPDAPPALLRWDAIFFLIIPLVFIAWQFSLKQVLLYCLVVLAADTIPLIFEPNRGLVFVLQNLPAQSGGITGFEKNDREIFFLLSDFMGSFARSVILAIVGWIENSLVTVQRSQHEQLAEANLKLQKYAMTSEKLAQTQERNRLARELHDTLAHTLSSTSVQLEAIKALFDRNPEQAKALLAQTLQNTKHGLAETRRALVDLRSSELEAYGLTQAIRNIFLSTGERGGFKVEFHLDKGLDVLPDGISHTIYRTAQEAAENILRHSNASKVEVSLLTDEGRIKLTIKDNGKGFDPSKVRKEHLGIRGMRERIEMLGGAFEIQSADKEGTEINISLETKYD